MKDNIFNLCLLTSALLHGAVIAITGLIQPVSQFAIAQAPHSMEISLFAQNPIVEPVSKIKESLTRNSTVNSLDSFKVIPEKKNAQMDSLLDNPLADKMKTDGQYLSIKTDKITEKIAKIVPEEKMLTQNVTGMIEQKEKISQPERKLQEAVVSVQGAATETKPLKYLNPSPVYPELARERGWEGIVTIKVLVTAEGSADSLTIEKSSGYQILDQTAVKTIKQWRFSPVLSGLLPSKSWARVIVEFKLVDNK